MENLLHRDTPILAADAAAPLAFDAGAGPLDLSARYQDKGVLGVGGMGEVRRVVDRHIGRRLAMKILKPNLLTKPQSVARFIEEAQVVGQLQHPGLVPVYDIGCLSDGRPYFTMREIKGRELGDVISALHTASKGSDWQTEPSGWTFRRIVRAFAWVCETVGYAHSKGVIHRDLKPSNILIGANDEVLVVDWGIAKVLGKPDARVPETASNPDPDTVITARSQDLSLATLAGSITGTPVYMPPEQAFGHITQIDARSDVYALGAVLYQILCGRAPYQGPNAVAVLVAVGKGPPKPVAQVSPRALPSELVEVCERAMNRDRAKRFDSAKDMTSALNDWLDSTKRHDKALQRVESAIGLEQSASKLRAIAETLRLDGETLLQNIPTYAPEEQKHPGWAKEDEAQNLLRQADLQDIEADQQLHAALTYVPDLAEAHAQLARRYLSEHRHAEATQQPDNTMRAEVRLRAHAEVLPTQSPERKQFLSYLRGIGALTLHTNPPGAEVHLYRYVERRRRLHEVFERTLGRTPLQDVPIEAGSYLCVIQHPDCEPVRYPVQIERQAHWDGIPPGENTPLPISLPKAQSLHSSEVYVPAGYYWAGGDSEAPGAITRRRLWVDGFVIARFPVTNVDYIGFLDALVAEGREEDALRFVPRERAGTVDELGASIYGRDEQGRFVLRADADGDIWLPDWPVLMVDWFCAAAYCAHLSEKTGQPWRLPDEWCREKAARGVDGRFFPWGNSFDASWCCMRDSHEGPPKPALVNSFPLDVSPYGARGMAGNSRDWCDNLWTKDGPASNRVSLGASPEPSKDANVVFRGGSWIYLARGARVANRNRVRPGLRDFDVGFRVARPLLNL